MFLQRGYQELIRSEGMIEHLVRGLKTENAELQQHCASAIFKVRGQAGSYMLISGWYITVHTIHTVCTRNVLCQHKW